MTENDARAAAIGEARRLAAHLRAVNDALESEAAGGSGRGNGVADDPAKVAAIAVGRAKDATALTRAVGEIEEAASRMEQAVHAAESSRDPVALVERLATRLDALAAASAPEVSGGDAIP
ncbi:MAG: hypothetical protein KDJ63_02615 [Nitratireductor sp.]|nr:hypothetical protein [Nitratireductor sp.]